MSDQSTHQATYTITEPVFSDDYTEVSPSRRRGSRDRLLIIILVVVGVVLVGFLLYLLFAKSSNKNSNQTGGSIDESKKVVLQWWGVFLDKDAVQPLIDEYQGLHPNVTIEYANKWGSGERTVAEEEYRSEVNKVLSKNQTVDIPDIFMVHNTWAGDYEKYIQPSTSYDYGTFSSAFYDVAVSDFTRNNSQVIGVPLWIDTLAILYNTDIMQQRSYTKPATEWNLFKKQAKDIKDNISNTGGFAAGTSNNVTFSAELLNLLMLQNGVTMVDPETGLASFSTSTHSMDALSFYKEFASSTGTWSSTFKNDSACFLEKKCAMIAVTSWRYRDILRFNEAYDIGLTDKMKISTIPQLQGQSEPLINWADYWGNLVALNRPNKDVAWHFLYWLSQPEQLRKLSQNVTEKGGYFGLLYPRKDMQQDLQGDEFLKTFNESLPYARSWDMIKGIEVREEFNNLINRNATSNEISSSENRIQKLMLEKGKL